MAHYAFLDEDNIVTEVITGKNESELIDGLTPEEWYGNYRGQRCVRTSYNNRIRKQFAGVGFTYHDVDDVFIAPAPFESWVLDENHDWQPPVPYPDDEGMFVWDEANEDWVLSF